MVLLTRVKIGMAKWRAVKIANRAAHYTGLLAPMIHSLLLRYQIYVETLCVPARLKMVRHDNDQVAWPAGVRNLPELRFHRPEWVADQPRKRPAQFGEQVFIC